MKKYKYLFFDFDGTLCNTFEGINEILDLTFEYYKINVDKKLYKKFVGPPLIDTFEKLLGEERATEAVEFFRKNYIEKKAIFKTKLYDGIADTIAKLSKDGYNIGVATCKKQEEAEMLLKYFGIEKNIVFVSGLCYNKRKTKKDTLEFALRTLNIAADECLMIGDTSFDSDGAASVGIDCLMCLWGFGDYENMESNNIVAWVSKPSQIIDFLESNDDKFAKKADLQNK